MTCSEYEILISMLADGELDERRAADVRAHIRACKSCAGVYNEYLSLQKGISLALADCDDLPDHLPDVSRVIRPRQRLSFGRVWAVAAALIVLVLGSYAYMRMQEHEHTSLPVTARVAPKRSAEPINQPVQPNLQAKRKTAPVHLAEQKPKLRPVRKSVYAKLPEHNRLQAKKTPASKPEHAPISVETAQISVEYVDADTVQTPASYGTASQAGLLPPIPDNRMLGTIVAKMEIISHDGVHTHSQYYRLLQPEINRENLGDTADKEPLQ
ncbi:MAG: zf-HC2 domain-containing protein [Armatimonadota bacterium]